MINGMLTRNPSPDRASGTQAAVVSVRGRYRDFTRSKPARPPQRQNGIMRIRLFLLAVACLQAQRPEYDFYAEGRDKKPEVYAEELRKAGIADKEITRRLDLLRNHRT